MLALTRRAALQSPVEKHIDRLKRIILKQKNSKKLRDIRCVLCVWCIKINIFAIEKIMVNF